MDGKICREALGLTYYLPLGFEELENQRREPCLGLDQGDTLCLGFCFVFLPKGQKEQKKNNNNKSLCFWL